MFAHDFDLQASHLQALSSRDAVVALFAQLGYNTEARLPMTRAILNRLKPAYQDYTTSEDVIQLLAAVKSDAGSEQAEPKPQPPAPALTMADLHLVCWEYLWS